MADNDIGLPSQQIPDEKLPSDTDSKDIPSPIGSGDGDKPAKRLIEVVGRKLVIQLALGSVVGAALLCSLGIFYPTLIPSQTSRFFLCLLTAFLFAVFVFTLYPNDYKLELGRKLSIPFVLVGPGALWIALFLFLWQMLPNEDIVGKVFTPSANSEPLKYNVTWVLNWSPSRPVYYKLQLPNDQNSASSNLLAGFYVQFDRMHEKYTAEIGIGPSSEEILTRYEVDFSRSDSTYQIRPLSKGDEKR